MTNGVTSDGRPSLGEAIWGRMPDVRVMLEGDEVGAGAGVEGIGFGLGLGLRKGRVDYGRGEGNTLFEYAIKERGVIEY